MKFLLFISVIVMIFVTGEAIKCFESYLIDKNFDKSEGKSVQCHSIFNACRLGIAKLDNGSEISQRSCTHKEIVLFSKSNLSVSRVERLTIKSQWLYICDTDECNSAQSISSNSIIILSTLTSILLAIKNLY